MGYDFTGRDLDEARERRVPETPSDSLTEAFEHWMETAAEQPRREIGGSVSEALYDAACDALDSVGNVNAREATSLLVAYPNRAPPTSGLFLTAAYNRADNSVVFFDASTPVALKWLGYRLDEAKTLVVDADVESVMAAECAGFVVNRATIDSYFGYSADGTFVNHVDGACATMGLGTSRVAVNYGTVDARNDEETPRVSLTSHSGTIDVGPTSPKFSVELATSLEAWRDRLSGSQESVREFLAARSKAPGRALVDDIEDALTEETGSD